jgi:DNA-binding response OmpR family regulator
MPENKSAFLAVFYLRTMNRLLIIEDERALLESMQDYLQKLGFKVYPASGYCEALAMLDQVNYDCLLVDLNLPDGDGLKIIKTARENQIKAGIIIISARESLDDRISGLETGADDYLVKPFHLAELGARVQSIIRRVRYDGDTLIRFGKMEVSEDEKIARYESRTMDLTPKELSILTYMISNKNRVVLKESLAEHIWGDDVFHSGSFDPMYTHIKNLRKKIQDLTGQDWLTTVYGIGYKLSIQE